MTTQADNGELKIGAVVLAAGMSRRMGRPKMILPWGDTTVIGRVVQVLSQAGIENILVVTGGAHREVGASLAGTSAQTLFNPDYEQDSMTISLQAGLSRLVEQDVGAALVVLGDQPQIERGIVEAVVAEFHRTQARLVVPSVAMRRGHPWIVARPLWEAILSMSPDETLRDFLNEHADEISYVEVESTSILRDLDTPGDYERERPQSPEQPK